MLLSAGMVCAQNSQEYSVKHLVFPEGCPHQDKISLAARLVPTQEQLDWQNLEMTAFLHFGMNTFTGREWGDGKESPSLFAPTDLDAEQWIRTLSQAGFKMAILTAKHHDGFCLWPTKTTLHSVASSPWKDGKGDVVREVRNACAKYGMKFGVYLSPWDRNAPCYGDSPAYNKFFIAQLTELLTKYGKVDGIWFDGWWDHDEDSVPFNWQLPEQYRMIHSLQPACIIGNNHHQTPFEGEDMQMFERDIPGENKSGLSGQSISQLPLETCQTMNGMWGYKIKDQDYKSSKELIRLLVRTAAKGANLLLNIGPQPNGELPATALDRLADMGKWLNGKAGESIYATVSGNINVGDSIVTTMGKGKDAPLYIHVLTDKAMPQISLSLEKKPRCATNLITGSNVKIRKKGKDMVFFPTEMKDNETDYIIKVEF